MSNYLIYKISGGLNHMMNAINSVIILSKKSGRKLIIDTNGGAFKSDFNDYFYIPNFNYETNFKKLYEDKTIDFESYKKYIDSNTKYVNGDYILHDKSIALSEQTILNSNEKILFFSVLKGNLSNMRVYNEKEWNIKVNKNTFLRLSKLPKINGDYIGVHYRNTDRKTDFNYIIKEINKYKNYNKLYFATDDIKSTEQLKKIIPSNMELIQYTIPFDAKGKNVHYGNPNKDEVIFNSLIDMYFLQKSKIFIPSPTSSFSRRIIFFRENDIFF